MLRSFRLLIRKAKRLTEFIAYGLFDSMVLAGCRWQKGSDVVAIVQLELLGDYVLWLPFGRAMVRYFSQRHRIVLVLNAAVLPLAKQHFPDCILLGIDRVGFVRSLSMRATLLRKLRQMNVTSTYHGTYPRDAIVEDAAVRALGAPAWGFDAPFVDRPWIDQCLSRRLYTHLEPPMDSRHQCQRHYAFIQALGVPATYLLNPPDFAAGFDALDESLPYFIIAPGASMNERCWPAGHFIAAARRILTMSPDWFCIVVGTRDEHELGGAIVEGLGERANNLVGKTDLTDLVGRIARARLVIGNDSAVCHIAAACGVPNIAVVGGGHHGRCFPYPAAEAHVRRLPVTVSVPMDCFGCDWICRYRMATGEPFPCIAAIDPKLVWTEAEKLISVEEKLTET